jgi:pimeloyl-ACP methyl ester carboxylesterase
MMLGFKMGSGVPIHYGQVVANQLATELISIDNASHMILLKQPDQVAGHILAFLLDKKG